MSVDTKRDIVPNRTALNPMDYYFTRYNESNLTQKIMVAHERSKTRRLDETINCVK